MSQQIKVQAPGSTANLGPGFDCFGLALSRHVYASNAPIKSDDQDPEDESSIIRIAYEAAGGKGQVWFHHQLEAGRGLGFSAAARAVGAGIALLEQGKELNEAKDITYGIVTELEGHGDNAAGSVYGGFNLASAQCARQANVQLPDALLLWIASKSSSTDKSRSQLASSVSLADAAANIAGAAHVLSCFYEGDFDSLSRCNDDRLHQLQRLECCPESTDVYEKGLSLGAHMGWLSGAGPSVAFIGTAEFREKMSSEEMPGGKFFELNVDQAGLSII